MSHEDRILVSLGGVEGVGRLDKDRRLLGMVSPGANGAILLGVEEWTDAPSPHPSCFLFPSITASYVMRFCVLDHMRDGFGLQDSRQTAESMAVVSIS